MLLPHVVQDTADVPEVPWNIKQVGAPAYWAKTKAEGVVVAVLDTGLDTEHPEFAGRVVFPRNFTKAGDLNDVSDHNGHGTHVAGIIGGANVGVAPGCRLMPLKVHGDDQADLNIQNALQHVLEHNRQAAEMDRVVVVNCSLGSPQYDQMQHYLIRRLVASGVAVAAAAGNSGDGRPDTLEVFYPGFFWECITCGAVNRCGQPAGYSNTHDGIDLCAPGTDIYSAWPDGGYKLLSGTSMAAPHVAGAYALVAAHFRTGAGRYPTVEEGEAIMFKQVRKLDYDPFTVGHGCLDLSQIGPEIPALPEKPAADSGVETIKNSIRQAGFSQVAVMQVTWIAGAQNRPRFPYFWPVRSKVIKKSI